MRDLLNPTNTNISNENVQPVISVSTPSAPVLTDPLPSTSSFSTTHVAPTIVQSQPVIGSADPNIPFIPIAQSGLPQSRPDDVVQQPRGNTIRLRIEFFSYKREVIQTQISAYIKKLSRKHPSFKAQDHQLLHVHDIMQFQVLGETSHVLAYDYFPIQVNLIQQVRPAQLYLSATIPGFEQNFVNASYTGALHASLGRSTILR